MRSRVEGGEGIESWAIKEIGRKTSGIGNTGSLEGPLSTRMRERMLYGGGRGRGYFGDEESINALRDGGDFLEVEEEWMVD